MTYEEIHEKINQNKTYKDFYSDLEKYANSEGIKNKKSIQVVYNIAYEMGHSAGYSEVLIYFNDLLEICKAYEN